ncbi:hypothetical protein VTN77DRAFT_8017 [Rasamsonia byssochlamydoides]|uniref:uncharacterized protein n=1 Tax=Rasamsonia byssochlamydoides TaxID=89139 RepID=UPI003743AA99
MRHIIQCLFVCELGDCATSTPDPDLTTRYVREYRVHSVHVPYLVGLKWMPRCSRILRDGETAPLGDIYYKQFNWR